MFEARRRPNPDHIVKTVATLNGVSSQDIIGRSRVRIVVETRQEMAAQLREGGFTYREIGILLGGRDHSTMVHGVRRALLRRESMQQGSYASEKPQIYLPVLHVDKPEVDFETILQKRKASEEKREKARQERERREKEKERNRGLKEVALPIVADHYYVSIEEMISKKRTKRLVHPRHALQYILSKETTLTLREIARVVGRGDHTVTLNAIRSVEAHLEGDEEFGERMEKLIREINIASSL